MSDVTESATINPVDETSNIVESPSHAGPTDTIPLPTKTVEPTPYGIVNPLYGRLHRSSAPHRWWLVVAIGLGLFVGVGQNFPYLIESTVFMSGAFSRFVMSLILLFYVASLAAAMGTFLTPILIALIGAVFTARETTADAYELILMTDLTNLQIVRAYLRIGLKRTRMLWAFYLALTVPALLGLVFNRQSSYYTGLVYHSQLIINLLIRLPWVLLGLVWGVWVAQRVRTPSGAILGAVIGMFVVQVLYSIITTFLQAITFFNYSYWDNGSLNPIGESPGLRNRRSRRSAQRSVTQRRPQSRACQTWIGST